MSALSHLLIVSREKLHVTISVCKRNLVTIIIDPENQKAVQAALTPVENKWMEVGIFLGLKMSGLQNAIHEEDDKIAYITKTFLKKDYMVTIYGEPTWKRIVGAIGAMAGGDNRRHAMEIAGQHPGITLIQNYTIL